MKCRICGQYIITGEICLFCRNKQLKNSGSFQKTFFEKDTNVAYKLDIEIADILEMKNGRFNVEEKLGQGGFGIVFKIRDSSDNPLAVKVLDLWRIKANEHDILKSRFEQEYLAGLVDSEHVVRNYSKGTIEGNPYIIMELCDGGNLAGKILEFINEKDYTNLAFQILEGLKALHNKNFIHRDLKPENILFNDKRKAKISDFGISGYLNHRLTKRDFFGASQEIWASLIYAPPEQTNRKIAFKSARPTMDIFSFGVMMFEVISGGKLPFGTVEHANLNPLNYAEKISKGQFESISKYRDDVNPVWMEILEKSMQPNPKKRYESVDQIITLIKMISNTRQKASILIEANRKSKNKGWLLISTENSNNNLSFCLNEIKDLKANNIISLGREDPDELNLNDISIPKSISPYMSRKQATFEFEHDKIYLRDGQWDKNDKWISSKNGTYVNDLTLDCHEAILLKSGDLINLGNINFKIFYNQ